jgi:signal transduction histidine kinase
LKVTLGLLIAVLLLAIGMGGWRIVTDLRRELSRARQKTDFVSNVSHELKTPLTSIRMFSELLAEGRVTDEAKRRSYLQIITSETARLTRLINNVLDFSRLERGEKNYNFQKCDLAAVVLETVESYRPHLEASGFQLNCDLPDDPVFVQGDRDALAQILVNLLSNAEKYCGSIKKIDVRLESQATPSPLVEVQVLDRGLGIPRSSEGKIFEQFYRAHDSLSSGIQGSGLGLTLARQIARAHGGDVSYEAREGGGSSFALRLPKAGES